MEKGEGGVVTRSCDSEIKVDEQCHLTNFGDSEGLEITENLRNYFKTNNFLGSTLGLSKTASSEANRYLI